MTQCTQRTHSAVWTVRYSPMLEVGAECQYGIYTSSYNWWLLFGMAWLRNWHSKLFPCGSADPLAEDAMDTGEICLCSLTWSPSMIVCPNWTTVCGVLLKAAGTWPACFCIYHQEKKTYNWLQSLWASLGLGNNTALPAWLPCMRKPYLVSLTTKLFQCFSVLYLKVISIW